MPVRPPTIPDLPPAARPREKLLRRGVRSLAEREALKNPDGSERLIYFEKSFVRRNIETTPPWLHAGSDGDAFFMAKPIDQEALLKMLSDLLA